ncbi:MAG: family 16 glycosylhydrolase [Halieaceae bacterium]
MACNQLAFVQGDSEPDVFTSYLEGPVTLFQAVADGTYDVTLLFTEPHVENAGERLFDVLIQGKTVVKAVDVFRYRDGQTQSALSVTIPRQVVVGGEFQLALKSVRGHPILSGILLEPATNTVTRKDRWQLSWQDLFNEPTLNSEHWNVDIWPPGKVNNEDQAYTDDERNLRIENGMLVLEAHRDRNNEPAFTSSRIHTRGKHDFLFGRVEVIARLPDAQGTWPAIWLLPSDPFKYASNCEAGVDWQGNRECDAWPNSGEIDMLEHLGIESGHIHGTVHTAANYWVNGQQRKGRLIQPTATQDFHVYALEWRPDRIDIFVDETRYFSYHRHESDSWQAWPFDQPFHLIINLAVGGNWGRAGGPIAEHKFPQRMLIDSVKVYQLAQ